MKLDKKLSFWIIYILVNIKALRANHQFKDNKKAKYLKSSEIIRNLQTSNTTNINTTKIYNITLTNFYINEDELIFIFLCTPKIQNSQDNITFMLNLQISRYDNSDGSWYSKNYDCYFEEFYNSGMYIAILDFNITGLTEIFIYDEIQEIKNQSIIYYINCPNKYSVVNPSKGSYLSNQTIQGQYDYYINITDFYIENTDLILIIDFKPIIPKNITLIVAVSFENNNESSGYYLNGTVFIEININNSSNKDITNLKNFNITKYKEISILTASIKNNINEYMIKVDFNHEKKMIIRNNDELNILNNTETFNNYYDINISEFHLNGNELVFMIDYFPKTMENITLILTLGIFTYNELMEYNKDEKINVTININNNSNIYTIILDNFNFDLRIEILIMNAFIVKKNEIDYFFIYYPNETLIYEIPFKNNTEIPSISYSINITDFSLNDTGITFIISFEPYTSDNIYLSIILEILSYNVSLGKWTNKYTNITILLDYYTNQYYSNLLYFKSTEYFEISISETFAINYNFYNICKIYYTQKRITNQIFIPNTLNQINPTNIPTNEPSYNSNNMNGDNVGNNEDNEDNINNDNNEEISATTSLITNKQSSGKKSIGIIIGIIAGALVIIGIIIFIIICVRKSKNTMKIVNNIIITDSEDKIRTTDNGDIYLEMPEETMRTFVFVTQNQMKIELSIECDKSIKDLIKLYFEKINRKDLFKDSSIYFLCGGKNYRNEEGKVENYFRDHTKLNVIIVVDEDDKIEIDNNRFCCW